MLLTYIKALTNLFLKLSKENVAHSHRLSDAFNHSCYDLKKNMYLHVKELANDEFGRLWKEYSHSSQQFDFHYFFNEN